MITFERVRNGVVMKERGEGAVVYAFDEDNLDGLLELLHDINDLIGCPGNKYDEKRIAIRLEHGNCFECKDPKCPICH